MKITKRQLRRVIKEEKAKLLREAGKEYTWPEVEFKSTNPYDDQPRATAMGHTAASDELFDARDNLLGLIEMLRPNEIGPYIDSLIEELEMMKRGA